MLNIHAVMTELAKTRAIFHSEADFQFALAWQIHEMMPDSQIRLEFKPFSSERMYLDIWIRNQETAIELKYLSRKLESKYGSEQFTLREQGAQDLIRYDFLKDIARIESVAQSSVAKRGLAILLTNDPLYWDRRRLRRANAIDINFHVHEGRAVTGELAWPDSAGKGTTQGRKEPITLRDSYNLRRRDYSVAPGTGNYRQFRYQAVVIGK